MHFLGVTTVIRHVRSCVMRTNAAVEYRTRAREMCELPTLKLHFRAKIFRERHLDARAILLWSSILGLLVPRAGAPYLRNEYLSRVGIIRVCILPQTPVLNAKYFSDAALLDSVETPIRPGWRFQPRCLFARREILI